MNVFPAVVAAFALWLVFGALAVAFRLVSSAHRIRTRARRAAGRFAWL